MRVYVYCVPVCARDIQWSYSCRRKEERAWVYGLCVYRPLSELAKNTFPEISIRYIVKRTIKFLASHNRRKSFSKLNAWCLSPNVYIMYGIDFMFLRARIESICFIQHEYDFIMRFNLKHKWNYLRSRIFFIIMYNIVLHLR